MKFRPEEEYLDLNSIQHYSYCKRQWGLMYIDDIWEENLDTRIGHYIHEKVDNFQYREKRGNKVIERSIPIISHSLQLYGLTDVVEFYKNKDGIKIYNYSGTYSITPVEYKKGTPKDGNHDLMQLVAQVICLEEMFHTKIDHGYLYYKKKNERYFVPITEELRLELRENVENMYQYLDNKTIPQAIEDVHCSRCSLKEHCFPKLIKRKKNVHRYITEQLVRG